MSDRIGDTTATDDVWPAGSSRTRDDHLSVRSFATASTVEALERQIAEVVLAWPGVVRIEPTLTSAVRSLRSGGDSPGAIRVAVRSRVVDVELDIAAHATHRSRDLAHLLHGQIDRMITTAGLAVGTIEINVLSIER